MRLNRRGQAVMGIGDGTVSVDGQTITAGGGACWLTDDTILYQAHGPQGYHLEAYNTVTKAKTIVAAHGANEIAAGGGRWACWGPYGVRTSTGLSLPKAGLMDVGRDGTYILCPDRQLGQGAYLYHPNGQVETVAQVVATAVRYVPPSLVWIRGGKVRGSGTGEPVTIDAPNYSPVPVLTRSGWWLLYQDGVRLLLQPWGSPVGYVVHDEPTTYSPDAVMLSDGRVRVAWSHTPGEGPTSLRTKDIDITAGRVKLDRVPNPGTPVPNPGTPPKPMPDYLSKVKRARDEFAGRAPSVERAWRITNRAVELLGEDFGLLAKPGGTNYHGYSIDIVMRKTGESFDILKDAEGAAVATWGRTTPTGFADVTKWRHFVADEGGSQPPPLPPPPPPQDVEARVTALERRCVILTEDLKAETAARVALASRLENLHVSGDTGQKFGHSHPITLSVEV